MEWVDQGAGATTEEALDLLAIAERFGVERTLARDVVGAVMSFCRQRHGASAVSDAYMIFLVAHSACASRGETLSVERINEVSADRTIPERSFMRALACSSDPSALHDAHRLGLIEPTSTGLNASGSALRLNLRLVMAQPHENLSFLWLSLFKRMAGWVADWRNGNPELSTLLVDAGRGGRLNGELASLFEQALSQATRDRQLADTAVVWLD